MKAIGTVAIAALVSVIAVQSMVTRQFRWRVEFLSDEAHHTIAYMLLGVGLTWFSRQSMGYLKQAAVVMAFAGAMELAQIALPHRNAAFVDFVYGACGGLTGVLVVNLALCVVARIKARRGRSDLPVSSD